MKKRILLITFALLSILSANAQITTTSSCDTNNDGDVNISDVTNTANKVLAKTATETQVVTAEQLNAILSEINTKLELLNQTQSELDLVKIALSELAKKNGTRTLEEIEDSIACNGHKYVDLGLPSGTLWATCNVGAENPEDYGDYFAWGETTGYNSGKTDFSWSTYKYTYKTSSCMLEYCINSSEGFVDNKTELDPDDDAAYVNWGKEWIMPSIEQGRELINKEYTTITRSEKNGVIGTLVTSNINGNSIFFPATGYRYSTELSLDGTEREYWSKTLSSNLSTVVQCIDLSPNASSINSDMRYHGRAIRPVRNK